MKLFAHAKINLFLKISNKRNDGYHNIYTGVTFINLYDKLNIAPSKNNSIFYKGPFAPQKGIFNDDIIQKLLNFLYIKEKREFFISIEIEKNIPPGSGLGGASADAAAVFKCLKKLKLINQKIDYEELSLIGADIPMCLKSRDCIAKGIGENIDCKINFPKYYFVLVKPNFLLSTKEVYSKLKLTNDGFPLKSNYLNLYDKYYDNDLEIPAIKINSKIKTLLEDLLKLDRVKFSRMTGSGSCCYAVFSKFIEAKKAYEKIRLKYPNWWSCISENNITN